MSLPNCHLCGGEYEKRRVRFILEAPGPAIFENVPAEVCRRCGDRVFGDDALERMDKIRDPYGGQTPETFRRVPVYDFEAAPSRTGGGSRTSGTA